MNLDRRVYDRARKSRDARFDGRFFIGVTTTRALRLISECALDDDGVEPLADRLGVTGRHLRRLFRRTYTRTPTQLRRMGQTHVVADPECYRFRLAYRPPYDWDAALDFLRARATPGVEHVENGHYRRTIEVDGKSGAIDVSRLDAIHALQLNVRVPDPRALLRIVERVRRVFDLGADPAAIAQHLRADPLLRRGLARHPGIRTPGAWDGFELAVRAILGQQISVRAATTIAGRIASMFGSPVEDDRGLARLFPTAAQLTNADVERAGVMPARAETIRSLARHVANGSIAFDSGADGKVTVAALKTLPGIGDWTAEYIAMRALGEPDAFPSGDLILRRAAGNCTARELDRTSQAWRPWRAYAVMLLWRGALDQDEKSRSGIVKPSPEKAVSHGR